jgi:hypothetical protein
MKTFSLLVVIGLAVGFPIYSYAIGCEYDTQCKNDRICENGKCVSPNSDNKSSNDSSTTAQSEALAPVVTYSCCTIAGKLGPYPNPGSDGKILHIGDACFGTTPLARQISGRVCN